jgi:hypothetical protein
LGAALTVLAILLCGLGCAGSQGNLEEEKLYTTYNIWLHASHNMMCINYKCGKGFLPAGTEVQSVEIRLRPMDREEVKEVENATKKDLWGAIIVLNTVEPRRAYRIQFNPKWHPGKTILDYKNNMVSTQDFEELTEGMTEDEINAIKMGKIVSGMGKRAVLCCYGPPPEHVTPSVDWPMWVYWVNKFRREKVCFDESNLTTECE